jgi:drug/metabolite transporter (DMT)-like permease
MTRRYAARLDDLASSSRLNLSPSPVVTGRLLFETAATPTARPNALSIIHHHISRGLVTIVVLSLLSAASYGMAAVLQHRAAIREPVQPLMRAHLLARLVSRPIWLIGNVLDGVGYVFQFLALRRGSLTLVEPILVLSLVFALPVAAWLDHRRISSAEWVPTAVIAVGLGLFLRVARPGLGHPSASDEAWAILTAVIVAVCTVLVLFAHYGGGRRSAVLQAAGSGAAFGYVAAVTERTGHLLNGGLVHTLASWEPYALVVAGAAALLLTQGAYNAGSLRLSLPTMTVAQPLVAVAIGLAMFGERIDARGPRPVFEVLGIAMVLFGVFALTTRSSLILPDKEITDEQR